MESNGRTKGKRGFFAEKISSDFCREGSAKEGDETRLCGVEVLTGGPEPTKGGKSVAEKIDVGSVEEEGTESRKDGEDDIWRGESSVQTGREPNKGAT